MASTIQVDKITDIGGNTMIESNGSGTFTNSLPAPTSGIAASAIDSGTIATARLGSGTASSSTFLRGDQTYAAAGGGKLLQVVANNYTTVTTISASGRTDLFTQAITPSVASSKILVSFSVGMGNNATGVSAINLLRDIASGGYADLGQGSGASHNAAAGGAYDADSNVLRQISYVYLDSPSYSVGNAITYKVQYYSNSATSQYINRSNSNATSSTSNIVLMEIEA